jgi:exonuclease III
MRIATWNVNNGDMMSKLFRLVERFHPDLAVLTEASKPMSKLPNVHWVKDSQTRGIAVYVSPGLSISPISANGPFHPCVHGYRISGRSSFDLLACWSHAGKRKDDYRECWVDGIARYEKYLKAKDIIIAGDLNDNAIWDRDYPWHPPIKTIFDGYREQYNVVSAYHKFRKEEYGKELEKSLCFLKNRSKRYHIDYILLPQAWMDRVTAVSLGDHGDWLKLSDHMPLMVEIKETKPTI